MKNLAVIVLSVTLFGSSFGCSRKQFTDAADANTYDQSVNRLTSKPYALNHRHPDDGSVQRRTTEGRLGEPDEIAAAVVWLCSDAAPFVERHAMIIDGCPTV